MRSAATKSFIVGVGGKGELLAVEVGGRGLPRPCLPSLQLSGPGSKGVWGNKVVAAGVEAAREGGAAVSCRDKKGEARHACTCCLYRCDMCDHTQHTKQSDASQNAQHMTQHHAHSMHNIKNIRPHCQALATHDVAA